MMKTKWIVVAALALTTGLVFAQSAGKPEAKKSASSSKKKVAESVPAAHTAAAPDVPLSAAELAIAERVQVGQIPCELGVSVSLLADPQAPGYFDVQLKQHKFRMAPVETSTGAIRLEDKVGGAVWLQLANKSMMMNQKLGQRLADACATPTQMAAAEALLKNPPVSILDAPRDVAQGGLIVKETVASADVPATVAPVKAARPLARSAKPANK